MVRVARNSVKTEQISIRLPVDLLNELESLKKRDGIDRSIIIVKALRYWVSVEGNVSTDNEFINQISEMKTEIGELKNSISELSKTYEKETQENRQLIKEQQTTINTLLRMVSKDGD